MTLTKRRSLRSTTTPTRRFAGLRTAVATVAVAGALFGCSSDKSTGPASLAGTYNMTSVNGPAGVDNSSPFVLFTATVGDTTYRLEAVNTSLTLTSNGRYTGAGTVNTYVNGALVDSDNTSLADAGTYTVSGNQVKFTSDDSSVDPITATLSGGNTLTWTEVDNDPDLGTISFTFTFKRQ